jgi:hypothetical protein
MTITMRQVLGATVAAIWLTALPSAAQICVAPGVPSAREHFKSAEAVFVGRLVMMHGPRGTPTSGTYEQGWSLPRELDFDVREAWKGVHDNRIDIHNGDPICAKLEVGTEYLVFAFRRASGDQLRIAGCGDASPVDKSSLDIRELGAPEYVYQADTR